MSARAWAAAATSASVHLLLMLILRQPAEPGRKTTGAPLIELEMISEPSVARPLDQNFRGVNPADTKAAAHRPVTKAAMRSRGARVLGSQIPAAGAPLAADPATAEAVPQVGGDADRLWTLRSPGSVPQVSTPRGHEMAEELFANDVPNVMKRRSAAEPSRIITGRGDVKLHVAEDGSIESFSNPPPHLGPLGATFDTTDMVMGALGMNPYRYEQHRLAEATREDRHRIRLKHQARNERQALLALSGELGAIWQNTSLTERQRRKLLFQRWDESREDTGDNGSALFRAGIESFIRINLPHGGPHAYSAAELAELNSTRTSKAVFAPYQAFALPARLGSPG